MKNKNIVITGGTSGLGRQVAIQLYEKGANIIVIARREELLSDLKKEYPNIITIQGDVSNKLELHGLAAQIHSHFKKIDILFNIASYLGVTPLRNLLDTECEDFEEVLQTNLLAPFRLTKLLIPTMLLSDEGVIVNISSDVAINAYEGWGAYSISKAAVDHMSRIFAKELEETGVKFLSVDPGDMATPMHFAAVPDANKDDLRDPKYSAELLIKELENNNRKDVRVAL